MVALPAPAHAAGLQCGSNWPHHRTGSGSVAGAYTSFHICWDNRDNARLDYDDSYVKDTAGDGKAARVYLEEQVNTPSDGWIWVWANGGSALATASGKGTVKHYDEGSSGTRGWRVVVCKGTKKPWESGSSCSGKL
jgi:hypothetical protein